MGTCPRWTAPPNLIDKALRSRYRDNTLRYAYPLASWSVERSSGPETGMVTLSNTDGFNVCFSMSSGKHSPRHLLRTILTSHIK
jgi:hypothetical protein